MKIYELAKIRKISSKELIVELNDPRIKNHLSVVPADILELEGEEKKIETTEGQTQTVDSAETVVVGNPPETPAEPLVSTEPVIEPCPYTPAEIELGCRCLGSKGKHWQWRHMLNG